MMMIVVEMVGERRRGEEEKRREKGKFFCLFGKSFGAVLVGQGVFAAKAADKSASSESCFYKGMVIIITYVPY
jgi:hypothetical protein